MTEHFEQVSVALNYNNYSLLAPFSQLHSSFFHLPPLYSWFNYLAIEVTGSVQSGEIVSLIFGLLTLTTVYKITEHLGFSKITRLASMFMLITSTLFLLLSGSIMPEMTMLFFSSISIFLFVNYLEKKNRHYLIVIGCTIFLSAFSKWQGIFTLIPIFIVLLKKNGISIFKKTEFYFLSLFPVILSSLWMLHINTITTETAQGKLLSRLFYNLDRPISKIFLSTIYKWTTRLGLPLLVFGYIGLFRFRKYRDEYLLILSWLGSGLLFYLLFLEGSYYHDHYTSLMLPPLAILAGSGVDFLSTKVSKFTKDKISPSVIFIAILAFLLLEIPLPNHSVDFQEDATKIKQAGELTKSLAKNGGIVALSRHATPVFYSSSIEIERINITNDKFTKKTLEKMKKKPQIVVAYGYSERVLASYEAVENYHLKRFSGESLDPPNTLFILKKAENN